MTAFTRTLRRMSARRIAAAGIVTVGALLLSACGDNKDDGMSGMDHGSGSSSATAAAQAGNTAAAADYNDADVSFSQMMIPHHKQAVEMAELADGRASDPGLKGIAAKIKKAQDPEINTMTSWLQSWGKPTIMGDMSGMNMGGGMMSDKDMKELKSMKGTEFDKMFAQMMIQHHEGAITMAKDEQKKGKNADATKMAGGIVTSQSAEVKQLQGILDRL
ncbi:DUF305 domain-containing protein [Streptomyces sp. NPDC046197]|uniref:DUF305 domain-containing protein n=1 Tax=Streptomyces sp. NPDC046197 TaxID=3154337 RepID=UPI0033CA2390